MENKKQIYLTIFKLEEAMVLPYFEQMMINEVEELSKLKYFGVYNCNKGEVPKYGTICENLGNKNTILRTLNGSRPYNRILIKGKYKFKILDKIDTSKSIFQTRFEIIKEDNSKYNLFKIQLILRKKRKLKMTE